MWWIVVVCCAQEEEKSSFSPLQEHQKVRLSGKFLVCRKYARRDIFSYCIYQKSEHLETLEDVHYYCSMTQEWEEACRHVWGAKIVRQRRELNFEELMDGCAGFSDCAFEILDAFPSKQVLAQLDLCIRYVSADQKDCISHTMQRWMNTRPSKQDVLHFMNTNPYHTQETLYFVGLYDYCYSLGVCEGQSNNEKKCRQEQNKLSSNPNLCRGKWGDMRR